MAEKEHLDLSPYRPFGVSMLKLLAGVALLALLAVSVYEFLP